jgi:hypothetical protein
MEELACCIAIRTMAANGIMILEIRDFWLETIRDLA